MPRLFLEEVIVRRGPLLRIQAQDVPIALGLCRRRDLGQPGEVCPRRVIEAYRGTPVANPGDRGGKMDDGVRLEGHRSVPRDAVCREFNSPRTLLQRLDRCE